MEIRNGFKSTARNLVNNCKQMAGEPELSYGALSFEVFNFRHDQNEDFIRQLSSGKLKNVYLWLK